MTRSRHIIAVLVCVLGSFATKADTEVISIVAQEMPGLIEPKAHLPYNRLLKALLEEAPTPTTQTILPGYRGVQGWLNRDYDCIFGGISAPGHKLPPQDTTITQAEWDTLKISTPFNILRVRAASMLGTPVASSLNALEGRATAIDEVLFLDLQLHTNATKIANPVKVDTAFKALDLLQSRRVNYALAYDNDIALYQIANPKAQIDYNRDLVVLELEESMMCWPGKGVQRFINHINETLHHMEQAGTLKQLTEPGTP